MDALQCLTECALISNKEDHARARASHVHIAIHVSMGALLIVLRDLDVRGTKRKLTKASGN
jgi:hypothetical protein